MTQPPYGHGPTGPYGRPVQPTGPQWQQPAPPWQAGPPMPPPYAQVQPPPRPAPRPRKAVTKTRGLSGGSHTFHLLMTVFTCGLWAFVWAGTWLFRMIVRRKSVTRYR